MVIVEWEDYDMTLQNMIDHEIRQGIYFPTIDTFSSDLKIFQDFFTEISNASMIDRKI